MSISTGPAASVTWRIRASISWATSAVSRSSWAYGTDQGTVWSIRRTTAASTAAVLVGVADSWIIRRRWSGRAVQVFDSRIDAHGAEHPPGHRVEKRLGQLTIGAARYLARMLRLHGGPDRPFHHPVVQDVVNVRDRRIHVRLVERQPLGGVCLCAGPVAPLEAALGPPRDLLEALLVPLVGGVEWRRRRPRRAGALYCCSSVTRSD